MWQRSRTHFVVLNISLGGFGGLPVNGLTKPLLTLVKLALCDACLVASMTRTLEPSGRMQPVSGLLVEKVSSPADRRPSSSRVLLVGMTVPFSSAQVSGPVVCGGSICGRAGAAGGSACGAGDAFAGAATGLRALHVRRAWFRDSRSGSDVAERPLPAGARGSPMAVPHPRDPGQSHDP